MDTSPIKGQSLNAKDRGIITVNPNLTFADRITRGEYDWTDFDLTEERFPVTEDQFGEWAWKLFHFNQIILSEKALLLIRGDGFEPAQTGHILTFGEINPEEQRKYPIFGLSSIASFVNRSTVPGLLDGKGKRGLDLSWFNGRWDSHCRFLGVCRIAATQTLAIL